MKSQRIISIKMVTFFDILQLMLIICFGFSFGSCSMIEKMVFPQRYAQVTMNSGNEPVTLEKENHSIIKENISEKPNDLSDSERLISENNEVAPMDSVHFSLIPFSDDILEHLEITRDDTSEKSEKNLEPVESIHDPFYTVYSKKLGIDLYGNENKSLILEVSKWLGTPYQWGGCSKRGIDCSCLVQKIYKDAYGIELNRTSKTIFKNDLKRIDKNDLQEGDILLFKMKGERISHIAIYLKDDQFVHASQTQGVTINHLSKPYYKNRFYAACRVPDKMFESKEYLAESQKEKQEMFNEDSAASNILLKKLIVKNQSYQLTSSSRKSD